MTETPFRPRSTSWDIGTANISPEHISGQGGPASPYLSIPLDITLQSAETQNRMGTGIYIPTGDDPIQDYTLHQIYGTLIFSSGGSSSGQITFHSFPLSFFSRPTVKGQVVLNIPLTVYQLQQIESQRTGDISLKFDFTFEFAKHYPIPRKQPYVPIEQFETNFFSMTVNVPRSNWADKVLPGLGYGKIYLVEVPTAEKAVGETIARAVEDFQHAQEQMLHGDYNKVLGHCRDALERLSDAKKYSGEKENPSFADKIDYLLTVLPDTPTGVRRTHLARLFKDLYGLTSMPEHPSPPHFIRDDAEDGDAEHHRGSILFGEISFSRTGGLESGGCVGKCSGSILALAFITRTQLRHSNKICRSAQREMIRRVKRFCQIFCVALMPYQILCNGTQQKSPEARSGLSLAPYRCTSLHNNRYGIQGVSQEDWLDE